MEAATPRNGGRRYLDCVWEFSTCGSSSSVTRRGTRHQDASSAKHTGIVGMEPGRRLWWSILSLSLLGLNRSGLRTLPMDGGRRVALCPSKNDRLFQLRVFTSDCLACPPDHDSRDIRPAGAAMSAGSLGSFLEAQTAKPPTMGVRRTERRKKRILAR